MSQRLTSAAVLVPVVLIVFAAGPPFIWLGIAALSAVAAYETARLVRSAGLPVDVWLAVAAAPIAVIVIPLAAPPNFFPAPEFIDPTHVLAIVAIVLMIGTVLALRHRDPAVGFRAAAGNTVASLYPSLLAFTPAILAIAPFVDDESLLGGVLDDGRVWILVLILTVWTLDSAAYVAGRLHGRGRFMNHISPNKTWSGAIGGTLAAMAVCTALLWAAGQNVFLGPGLGLLIAVAAQAGDLVESMLKRAAGAKDSGQLLPGHGGILDRVDSFVFAGPAMYLALALINELPT